MLDTVTGEVVNITLRHEGNDVRGMWEGRPGGTDRAHPWRDRLRAFPKSVSKRGVLARFRT